MLEGVDVFFQAELGIRERSPSHGRGDVYKGLEARPGKGCRMGSSSAPAPCSAGLAQLVDQLAQLVAQLAQALSLIHL